MRPTDEDQPSSRRPNLMSATRRAASETNILAMLDRQASIALPQRLLRSALAMPAVFWYGTAGVLVCGMVATLAWLAHDGGASAAVDTALAGSAAPSAARATELATSATASVTAHVPVAAAAPVSDPAPKTGATIVNVAPAVPPAAAELVAEAPGVALPQRQQSGHIAPRELQRDPPRLPARAVAVKTALSHAPAQGKPAAVTLRPAALAHAEPAPARSRRQPMSAKAATTVDTDVALISAIIQHAATRQEAEEAACADKACGPRMPAKP